MAMQLCFGHHVVPFDLDDVARWLETAVYHAECALKETYNTACLALAETARGNGVKVVLTGQGADELFADYIGYRFDAFHDRSRRRDSRTSKGGFAISRGVTQSLPTITTTPGCTVSNPISTLQRWLRV